MARWMIGAAAGWWSWRRLRGRGSLAGKVVLITGGSRGLGLLLARELARGGAKLVLCARDLAELDRAQKDLAETGAEVLTIPCDLSRRVSAEELVAEATRWFGRVDVLVNNAGIMRVGPLESLTLGDFETVMATNFWGALHATWAVLPQMRQRRSGQIVNITSIGGRLAFPHLAAYSASKFAMVGLSESMRVELTTAGIRVTTVVPGFMRTGSPLRAEFRGHAAQEYAWFASGGAFPLTSMEAHRAARQIVRACERGDAYVTIGTQAKLLGLMHDLSPGLTARLLAFVDRWLPAAPGRYTELRPGYEVTDRTPPAVERRIEAAAAAANQGGDTLGAAK